MENIQSLDFSILDGIQNIFACGFMNSVMPVISAIGGGYIWCIFGIIALFFKKIRINGISVLTAFTVTVIITEFIIKPMFMRERPFEINTQHILITSEPFGSSFPSAHSSSSFASAMPFFGINKRLGVGATILAALVAFSRLYLYVHFPTDVLFGSLFGVIMGIIISVIVTKADNYIKFRKQGQQ